MDALQPLIDGIRYLIDLFLHLDKHLGEVISQYGLWTYAILFIVIFCETGLVVTPILPGDSLLFAAGALCNSSDMRPDILIVLLIIAAILGDAVNYAVGRHMGPMVMNRYPRIFRKEYLDKTQAFYEKYGGKTIIFARFIPIVRTFAPFLAGVGKMGYSKFALYNVVGGVVWIVGFVMAGYWFGTIPVVKKNFTLVILAIIFLSILPALIEAWKAKKSPAV